MSSSQGGAHFSGGSPKLGVNPVDRRGGLAGGVHGGAGHQIAAEKNNAVAGLVNFMRNIGSSVGTSLVTTIIARRSQYHQGVLAEHGSIVNSGFQGAIQGTARQLERGGLSIFGAQQQATARLYAELKLQAASLAYIDTYWVLAVRIVFPAAEESAWRQGSGADALTQVQSEVVPPTPSAVCKSVCATSGSPNCGVCRSLRPNGPRCRCGSTCWE